MMTTLLLAEHDNKSPQGCDQQGAHRRQALGGEVARAGRRRRLQARSPNAAAKLDGVAKVLLAEAPRYEHQLAEPIAALIVSLAGNYDALVAPATTTGKNVMPRVAALLDVMQISEIIKVVAPDTFERPIYAGNAIQTVQSTRRQESHHRAHRRLPGDRRGRLGADRDGRRRGRSRCSRRSSARSCRSPTGRS